ncbi:hypothetical protein OIU78_027943, partial [Salix suchowensis]
MLASFALFASRFGSRTSISFSSPLFRSRFGRSSTGRVGIRWPSMPWNDLLLWASNRVRGIKNNLQHTVAKIVLSAVVYFLWFERNNRSFNRVFKTAANLSEEIVQLVRLHISSSELLGPIPQDMMDR